MKAQTIDQVTNLLVEVQLVIKFRDMRLIDSHRLIVKLDPEMIDRLSRQYWAIDIADLLDIEAKAMQRLFELADISELTKSLKS